MSRITSLTPPTFSPKHPAETIFVAFDFAQLVAGLGLSAPVVTASVSSGTDGTPSALLGGAPSVAGTRVVQRVTGGLAGVTYRLQAQVDASDGSRWVLVGLLPVRVG